MDDFGSRFPHLWFSVMRYLRYTFDFAHLVGGKPHCTSCAGTPTHDYAGKKHPIGWPCPQAAQPASKSPPPKPSPLKAESPPVAPPEKPPVLLTGATKKKTSVSKNIARQAEKESTVKPLPDESRYGFVASGGFRLKFGEKNLRFETYEYLQEYTELRDGNGLYLLDKVRNDVRYYRCAEGTCGRAGVSPNACKSTRVLRCIDKKNEIL